MKSTFIGADIYGLVCHVLADPFEAQVLELFLDYANIDISARSLKEIWIRSKRVHKHRGAQHFVKGESRGKFGAETNQHTCQDR